MNFDYRKIRWDFLIAFVVNVFLIILFFVFGNSKKPPEIKPAVEITVDISDFKPPVPKEMVPPNQTSEAKFSKSPVSGISETKDPEVAATEIMGSFTPEPVPVSSQMQKDSADYKSELVRIEQGIRTFDGVNQVRAGLPEGTLPPGHQIGASFQGRGDLSARRKKLKRHGGSEQTESAVEKALKYLALQQNPNGSWGSPESFKTGDAAALSSLALLAFFSHGETFQSKRYGDNIRKGCDFLIELANAPNIEYAGKGFGHAILTYALAEGFAVTGSLSLRNALENRMKYILSHQNAFGSFAMNYDNSPQPPPTQEQLNGHPLFREIMVGEPACDLSLLGWHIQALTAAKNAGINMANLDKSLTMALEALVKIHQAEKGGFSQGINMKRFPANDNMIPVGLLGMYFLNAGNSSPARRAERFLEKTRPPQWGRGGTFPLYRWYYQTQALFQIEKGRGKRWKAWNENLKKELLKVQNLDGSWQMPAGDNSFRLKNKTDLSIYSSSLCSLILQVYYRYLPSYSIAESSGFDQSADNLDLGGAGLMSRLPGGADPMAAVILGVGTNDMQPIRFGVFNGMPRSPESPLVSDEFTKLASLRSTIAVRTPADWPQTLQANQRIALFFDELLPGNFKGSMRLLVGIIGSDKTSREYQQSLEVVLNGKRLFNSFLLCSRQLLEIAVPGDLMLPYGNILQIRNNGKTALAFDAAVLKPAHQVGKRLYLLAKDTSEVPEELRTIFNRQPPEKLEICRLSSYTEERQLLPEISSFDSQKIYIGEYAAVGSESMGNEFQRHYLRQTGREIIDWISGGGSGVIIKEILSGGKLYDSVFHVEYPAASALKQTAKLFEGSPRKLSSQVYPRYGEKPGLFLSSAASYNAPGVATVVVARRFSLPEESEVIALIPWNGETDMVIERGFLPEKSPFTGFAPKIERERKTVAIKDNIFRYSAVFPELTVIRLIRKGSKELPESGVKSLPIAPKIEFDHDTVQRRFPCDVSKMKKTQIRQSGGYTSIFGRNAACSRIPATIPETNTARFIPAEKESVCVTFRVHRTDPKRFDSAYLLFGNAPAHSQFLTFDIFTRISGLKKKNRMSWVTFRFALCGKLYSTTVRIERWEKVVIPLKNINPAWQSLRILEPAGIFDEKLQTISFEINDIATYSM